MLSKLMAYFGKWNDGFLILYRLNILGSTGFITVTDSAIPKGYRPISLLCHMYKLYGRIILNIISPTIEQHLIKEQVGFRPGKPYTSQLTQHIEDGYQE